MRLSIFGCGNMGSAVASAIRSSDPQVEIFTYTPSGTKAQKLAKLLKGFQQGQLKSMFPCDVIMLGMKPQQFFTFAESVKEFIDPKTIVISLLAGVTIEQIQNSLNVTKVIRLMPNTPTLIGRGVIPAVYSINDRDLKNLMNSWLSHSAKLMTMKSEDQLDKVMAVSASGPALLFEMARFMYEKLISDEVSPKEARMIVSELFAGTGELMLSEEVDFSELRNRVTSKGGVTEASLNVLNNNNQWGSLLSQAFEANYRRGLELKKGV